MKLLFFDTKGYFRTRGYLGAYMDLGMAPGLLFQIVSELRKKIPEILGDYKLTQAWAYKYVEDLDGIILYLASNQASAYVTGSIILVDGGLACQ